MDTAVLHDVDQIAQQINGITAGIVAIVGIIIAIYHRQSGIKKIVERKDNNERS